MNPNKAELPAGYNALHFDVIDSTNAEALRRAGEGAAAGLWIRAARQSAGRGRSGRRWQSDEGNLFASLLLRPTCRLERTVQLAFVAGIAACDAVAAVDASLDSRLALKWPNDILLEREKLGGILLESVSGGGGGAPAVVIGTGLNLVSHPADAATPATDLAAHAVAASAEEAFHRLAAATARWLDIWAEGASWPEIVSAWQARSVAVGTPISVNFAGRAVEGRYAGIDAQGGLRIETGGGQTISVTAGDIFLL